MYSIHPISIGDAPKCSDFIVDKIMSFINENKIVKAEVTSDEVDGIYDIYDILQSKMCNAITFVFNRHNEGNIYITLPTHPYNGFEDLIYDFKNGKIEFWEFSFVYLNKITIIRIYCPKINYHEYIKSEQWNIKRKERLRLDNYKCKLCSATNTELHVHHNSYENLGNEPMQDLITLCKECHSKFHSKDKEVNDIEITK